MADVAGLPYQVADELKAHRTECDLDTALWNGDVANQERWPDRSLQRTIEDWTELEQGRVGGLPGRQGGTA